MSAITCPVSSTRSSERFVAIQADWIVPVISPPIRNGWLVAIEGRIDYVGESLPERYISVPQIRLTDRIIVPGLVNTHCHLEFSDLEKPLPFEGSFIRWIGSVVRHRREQAKLQSELANYAEFLIEQRTQAMVQGLEEAYQTGTRYVLDTITEPWSNAFLRKFQSTSQTTSFYDALVSGPPLYYQVCPEVLDINQLRFAQTKAFADKVLSTISAKNDAKTKRCTDAYFPFIESLVDRWAISPHAPYTASLPLVERLVHEACHRQGIVSIHLAESAEERTWLTSQTGPIESALKDFRDQDFTRAIEMLRQQLPLHVTDGFHVETELSPFSRYLESLATAPNTLLAHGNQFSDQDLQFIASRNYGAGAGNSSMAIVHCPRTYRHFHPDPQEVYPMSSRLELGVPHFLGTDSKASNPDLDLWQEVLQVIDDGLSFDKALSLVTTAPADFLGVSDIGSIAIGKRSLCSVIQRTNANRGGVRGPQTTWQQLISGESSLKVAGQFKAVPLEIAIADGISAGR